MTDINTLIQAIREEAQRPEYQVNSPRPMSDGAPAAPVVTSGNTALAVAATPPSPDPNVYTHVDELLLISDPDRFIATAYQCLLRRAADAPGAQYYRQRLAQGYGQMFVLAALRTAPEGQRNPARLGGFGLSKWIYFACIVGLRLGLAAPTRWLSTAYSAWRHLRLVASGRLATHLYQTNARLEQALAQQQTARLHAEEQLEQQRTWNTNTEQRLAQQTTWNARTVQHLEQQSTWNELSVQRLEQQAAWNAHTQQQLEHLQAQQTELQQGLHTHQQAQTALAEQNRFDLQLLRARLQVLYQRIAPAAPTSDTPTLPAAPASSNAALDDYYLAFEDAMRGDHAAITQKLQPYLSHLAQLPADVLALPMLDLGCGRGEWLELLCAQGFEAQGLDLNPAMVQHCRSRGLRATHGNALAWLAQQADASLGLLSAFHLIEHLPFEQLFQLLAQAWRVLAPGGVLVLETPNPENVLVGSHTFYHDHTHRNPVTPTSLRFLLGYHGFAQQQILRLNPYPDTDRVADHSILAERVNGHLYGPQDYGVVAHKT